MPLKNYLISVILLIPIIAPNSWGNSESSFSKGIFVIDGVSEQAGLEIAMQECKKYNHFLNSAKQTEVISNLWIKGKRRVFRCAFHSAEADLERPSSIKQKVMQSRRLLTNDTNVKKAIQEWAKDLGGSSHMRNSNEILVYFDKILAGKILTIEITISTKNSSSVDLRIRTKDNIEGEIFNQTVYKIIFDGIAGQLFVDAIEIEPQEIQ